MRWVFKTASGDGGVKTHLWDNPFHNKYLLGLYIFFFFFDVSPTCRRGSTLQDKLLLNCLRLLIKRVLFYCQHQFLNFISPSRCSCVCRVLYVMTTLPAFTWKRELDSFSFLFFSWGRLAHSGIMKQSPDWSVRLRQASLFPLLNHVTLNTVPCSDTLLPGLFSFLSYPKF